LIARLMSKDPGDRPASAREVAGDLARLTDIVPTPRRQVPRWVQVAATLAVGAALVVVLSRPWQSSGRMDLPTNPQPRSDPAAREPGVPRLVAEVAADQHCTDIHALALARTEAGPVLLSEGFPRFRRGDGVRVWTRDLAPLGILPTRGEYIRTLAATKDGRRFLTVGGGGLEVWVLEGRASARKVVPADVPPGPIGSIAVDPAGRRVYTTDYAEEGPVRAYELTTAALKPAAALPGQPGVHGKLVISPDGRWVGATGKAGRVCVWDARAADGPIAHVLRETGPDNPVLAFAADGRLAWVVDGGPTGAGYDLSADPPRRTGSVPTELGDGVPVAVFTDRAGGWLVAVGQAAIQVVTLADGSATPDAPLKVTSPIRSATFDSETGRLFTGHDDGLRAWDVGRR
jgi:WD40 repeat protein